MSKFDYEKISKVVVSKMEQFGTEITLIKSSGEDLWDKKFNAIEARDYWENSDTGEIVYTQPDADLVDYRINSLESDFTTKELKSDLIKITDIKLYLDPSEEPEKDDIIIKDSISYKLYFVKKIQPADKILMYLIYGRN